MHLLRSIIFVALAAFAGAFVSMPAVAAVSADYPAYDRIHQDLKSRVTSIATIAADHAIQRCKLAVVQVSIALGRSIHVARSYGPVLHSSHRLPSVEFFRRC